MEKISVVIPMYNSEKSIRHVIDELISVLTEYRKFDYEIIVVDDCGDDGAIDVVKEIAHSNEKVKIIELAKNSGQANAMFAGYMYCTGDFIVSMDDDYQHPAASIIGMMEKLIDEDLDVVIAKYPITKNSFRRKVFSRINRIMASIMTEIPADIQTNSFFVMRKIICETVCNYPHNTPYVYGIIFTATSRVANYDVIHRERLSGKSNYAFGPLFRIWLNGFFSFSAMPLKVVASIGLILAVVAGIMGLVILVLGLIANQMLVQGWTSTVLLIIFFSGMQLLSVGLLGGYISRMYSTQSRLPNFLVRKQTNFYDDDA